MTVGINVASKTHNDVPLNSFSFLGCELLLEKTKSDHLRLGILSCQEKLFRGKSRLRPNTVLSRESH